MQALVVFFLARLFRLNREGRARYHWLDDSRYEVCVAVNCLVYGIKDKSTASVPLNRKDGRGVSAAGIRAQDIEKVGKPGHADGVEGFYVTHVFPVLASAASMATSQIGVKLGQSEAIG